jgi:hypothetical protein
MLSGAERRSFDTFVALLRDAFLYPDGFAVARGIFASLIAASVMGNAPDDTLDVVIRRLKLITPTPARRDVAAGLSRALRAERRGTGAHADLARRLVERFFPIVE